MLLQPRRCGMLRKCCGIPYLSTATSRTRDPSSSCNHLSGRSGRKSRSRSRQERAQNRRHLRRNLRHLRPLWGRPHSLAFLLLLPHLGRRSQQSQGLRHRGRRFPDRRYHQRLARQYLAGRCHQRRRLRGPHRRGPGRQHSLPPVLLCPAQQCPDLWCHLRQRRKQCLRRRHPRRRNLLWLDPQQPRLLPHRPHLGVRCRRRWPRGPRSRERHVHPSPSHPLLRRQRPSPLPLFPRWRNHQQPPHQGRCPLGQGRRHRPSQSLPRQNPRWRNRPSQSRR